MTKHDLIKAVAERLNISVRQADEIVNSVFDEASRLLNDAGELTVRGFGRLSVVTSAPRMARNIKTGAKIQVPARNRLRFKSYMDVSGAKPIDSK